MNALPPTLDRFGDELEDAVRRDLGHRRRRRRAIRGAVVLAAVAAAALGLLSVFGTGGPSVVDRAAAALQSSDDSILHYRFNATQRNGDGTTATWQQETWQLLVPPYTRRQIAIDTDAPRAESLSRGGLNELYDASDDTIYIATSKELRAARMPKIEIVSQAELERLTGSSKATAAYLIRKGGPPYKVVATEEGARGCAGNSPIRGRTDLRRASRGVPLADPRAAQVREGARGRSRDGRRPRRDRARVARREVDATSWTRPPTTRSSGRRRAPTGASRSASRPSRNYRSTADSRQLLSLQDQHPNAQVVRGAAAYIPAESRLYPHG